METRLYGDCLEIMKTLPDKSIDLFLCDLPYGSISCEWDVPINLEQFWIQVERLMRNDNTPILYFCSTKFGFEIYKSRPDWFRYDLIWNKTKGVSFLLVNKMPMRSHENIHVYSKKSAQYYRKDVQGKPYQKKSRLKNTIQYNVNRVENVNTGTRSVLSVIDIENMSGHKGGIHPTQKPEKLYEWLIERYSQEGDTILDPTAGSFTSTKTAVRMKRNGIGIELKNVVSAC